MHLPVRKAGVTTRKSRGQSLVELALVAPVVLLLVLIALDFGRVFLGWVSLNNAARVGANFAALHPGAWPGDADAEASYIDLIEDNADAINCELNPSTPQPPSFGGSREIGQPVTVNLRCDFELLTPIVGSIVGPTIAVRSESTFPISKGCLDDCPSGPGPTAPPPPENNCRDIPDMVGMSVAGARLAWIAEGFSGATFDPATGDDTRTIESQVVTEPTNDENCPTGEAIFTASVVVELEDLVTPPPTPTCLYVPNMIGMVVADARDAWTGTGFLGEFLPTDEDERIVLSQVTDPASDPGDCLEPDTTVSVTHGAPYPDPPPAPCLVPSLVNTGSDSAVATWTDAGFDEDNLEFDRPNQLPYTIVSQTLVGGTYQSCTSSMEVSDKP